MDRRSLRIATPIALAVASALALAGCVYGVDDYDLPDGSAAPATPTATSSAPPVSPPPVEVVPELRLPDGCSIDDVRIDADAPLPGAAGRLVAVRTQTVRVPAEVDPSYQRLVIEDFDLGNDPRISGDVSRLIESQAWIDLLLDQFRSSGVVSPTFGDRVVTSSFQPSLDEKARYVIGYISDELRVPFSVTACDGSRLGAGELVGVDPPATGGSAVLRCGTDQASEESLTALLAAYCDN